MGRPKKRRKPGRRRRVRAPKLPATPTFLKKVEHSDDIKKIYTYFIKPLTEAALQRVTNVTWFPEDAFALTVNYFFRTSVRSIYFCRALREFQLPGEYVSGATTNNRTVPLNAVIFVRYDEATEFVVDVEYADQNFRLSAGEWNVIKDYLKVVI